MPKEIKLKRCPIEVGFYRSSIGKKWTLSIIRLLLLGPNQFSDFLKFTPGLSSKVLSERLKELMADGIIEKKVISASPIEIRYSLTPKGFDLNRVLYELSLFGAKYHPDEVFGETDVTYEEAVEIFGRGFKLPEEDLIFDKMPQVEQLELLNIEAGD